MKESRSRNVKTEEESKMRVLSITLLLCIYFFIDIGARISKKRDAPLKAGAEAKAANGPPMCDVIGDRPITPVPDDCMCGGDGGGGSGRMCAKGRYCCATTRVTFYLRR